MDDQDASRFVCIHGHFYQPPRENPWLDAIEIQDSAAPFHDWNERITAECYAPNTAARLLDEEGFIVALRNNYERISFNFGPTLLSWLERARPEVYAAVLAADHESQRRLGRGNALAQVYGHCIMPLATPRDRSTQVRWGIADFVHRFGRRPDGMWLPETAMNLASLRTLAEQGIRFTILAPGQAARVRHAGGDWQAAEGNLDPSRPYRCELGNGRTITLFFYDGAVAHAIAFGGLLSNGRELAGRLTAAALAGSEPGLAHVATDGESYGHHHRFGEMALAAAIDVIEREQEVQLTNYATYLDRFPPHDDVEIHEDSSWSCSHGIERWRSDCGCNSGHQGWRQPWRTPLRDSLNWLKQQLDERFEEDGVALLSDVWEARDAYIGVILERDAERREAFLGRYARRPLNAAERSRVWQLLEMQRYNLLSFTSCGWFFDDPSGLETVQILTYAARAMQLAGTSAARLEEGFLERLAPVRSNLAQYPDGGRLYRTLVRPLASDHRRIVAHYAMNELLGAPEEARSYVYRVTSIERTVETAASATLAIGRVRLFDEVTEDGGDYAYAALHLGGHEVQCAVVRADPDDFVRRRDALLTAFRSTPLTELPDCLEQAFAPVSFTLDDVFVAERRRILEHVTMHVLDDCSTAYEDIVTQNRNLIDLLTHGGAPLPEELRLAATFVLRRRFVRALEALVAGAKSVSAALAVVAEARRWGVGLDTEVAARQVEQGLADAVQDLRRQPSAAAVARVHTLLDVAEALALPIRPVQAQNEYYALAAGGGSPKGRPAGDLRRLGERLHFRLPGWTQIP